MNRIRRIKDLREDSNLSQEKLAKKFNMAQTTYSGYETGNRNIPTDFLIELALYYNTSIDYILGLTNEKTPPPRINN